MDHLLMRSLQKIQVVLYQNPLKGYCHKFASKGGRCELIECPKVLGYYTNVVTLNNKGNLKEEYL